MSDENLLRYSCQINLPGFGKGAQEKLKMAAVLIVGAGGLGCPCSQYLVSSGVGTIGICDFDTVSESNLHRQILYTPLDIGSKKAIVACNRLSEQNPVVSLIPYTVKLTSANVIELVKNYDVIIDCTDNFDTKYLLNDACVLVGKPLVFGAIYQFEGQVGTWNIKNQDGTYSPNYRDLFPEVDGDSIPNCAEGGVIPTLAGIIGCMQANEVIKIIVSGASTLQGKILIFDSKTLESRLIEIGSQTHTNIISLPQSIAIPEISIAELKICMRNATVELVDVRSKEERESFHLGGWHIPLQEIEHHLSYFNSGKALVFYCGTGKRSTEAVKKILKVLPHAKIYSLAGGTKAWLEQA